MDAGRRSEANAHLRRAVRADPELREAHVELCLALHESGDVAGTRSAAAAAIVEGGFWCDAWQRPSVFLPGLEARPFWDAAQFPWVSELEAHFQAIRGELDGLAQAACWADVGGDHRSSGRCDGEAVLRGDWQELVLFGLSEAAGEAGRAAAPVTAGIVQRLLPEAVSMAEAGAGEVVLSLLAPGTRVAPHCARTNHRLTCHLGLRVPAVQVAACGLRVGAESRTWSEGRALVFDDSFEHEVWNEASEARVVLLIRFWHPGLASAEAREGALVRIERDLAAAQRLQILPPLAPGLLEPSEALEECLRSGSGAPGCVCSSCGRASAGADLVIAEDRRRVIMVAQCCGHVTE